MVDMEKVIKGLEIHTKPNSRCIGCPYPNNGLCGDQLYMDALELLKGQPQWISVEDRLPPDDQMVIGYTPVDGYMFVGFHKTHKYAYIDTSYSCWYIITSMRSTKHMHKKVTHWMPLPEPPEGVKTDGMC